MIKSKLDNDILLPELPGCFMPLNVSPSQNNLDKTIKLDKNVSN